MIYNGQQSDWTKFTYDLKGIEDVLFSFAARAGRVSGILEGLPDVNGKSELRLGSLHWDN